MFLLAYRTSKHEATGVTPSELFCGRDLTLPMDLLRGTLPSYGFSESAEEYVRNLRQKLDEIQRVRERLESRSLKIKCRYECSKG
ncbi:hypothetical protein P5V15_003047 [Pogonomyrmex californicus]